MARKKGTSSGADLQKKLTALEAILGSQKKAAERLGVSTSTYRQYKTGKAAPDKDKSKRINRVFGQNKRKLSDPKIEKRIERREKAAERKRAAAEITNRKRSIVVEATSSWLRREYGDDDYETYMVRALDSVSMYVAYDRHNPETVQFTDGIGPLGKPKRTMRVKVWALYSLTYQVEAGQADVETSDLKESMMPIMVGLDQEWDLQTTINYLESHLMDTAYQVGRRRYIPIKLIGFEL